MSAVELFSNFSTLTFLIECRNTAKCLKWEPSGARKGCQIYRAVTKSIILDIGFGNQKTGLHKN